MKIESIASDVNDFGATVVITHRVRHEKQAEYEQWLSEISPLAKSSEGLLDWHLVRPIPDLTSTYTIIIRFDNRDHLHNWMNSSTRNDLIEKAQPLLVNGDDFFINSGLDFWFVPEEAKAKVPARWRQYLITWSAIYPLALITPLLVLPLLHYLGVPNHYALNVFVVTGITVFLMVYLVMPRYTKLVRKWLFT